MFPVMSTKDVSVKRHGGECSTSNVLKRRKEQASDECVQCGQPVNLLSKCSMCDRWVCDNCRFICTICDAVTCNSQSHGDSLVCCEITCSICQELVCDACLLECECRISHCKECNCVSGLFSADDETDGSSATSEDEAEQSAASDISSSDEVTFR